MYEYPKIALCSLDAFEHMLALLTRVLHVSSAHQCFCDHSRHTALQKKKFFSKRHNWVDYCKLTQSRMKKKTPVGVFILLQHAPA